MGGKQHEIDILQKMSHSSMESNKNIQLEQITSANGDIINVLENTVNKLLERKITRKLDIRILPLICIMYLFNALNKGNISNAKTNGIELDLGMDPEGDQWNLMLSLFYIPFVLFAFPISLIIKKFNAARVLPILVFTFGSITLLLTSAFNFLSLMAGRWFLGMCESAVLPGVIYYLSCFYRRNKLGSKLSIIYSFSAIANAFSGLLAFGCFQIDSSLKGWQILFLLEGSLTLLVAVLAFVFLPRDIDSAKFFSEEEKDYAKYIVRTDSSAAEGNTFEFRDAIKVFKHPITWAWMFEEICIGVPLNSINNWFPQIIQALGKGTVQTNLLTIAPNIVGAICLLILAFSSDHFRIRSIFLVIAILATLIGFVVYGSIDILSQTGVAYFACFLMTSGASASSVLTSTWYNNNNPNNNRRVMISSVAIPLANAAGLISANIFLPKDAPKYTMALGITGGFGGMAVVVVCSIGLFMVYDNRKRDRIQGVKLTYRDVPTSELREGPSNPSFRWMY